MRALPLAMLMLSLQAERVAAGALERAMLGKSVVVDLTHSLSDHLPSPGSQDRPPQATAGEAERNGAAQRLSMSGDLGTHLDLPATVVTGKPTVANIPVRDLLVHAVLVDVSTKVAQTPDYRASVEDLQAWERRNGRIPKSSVVLLHTGWARRWSDPARYTNLDSQGAARAPGFSLAALKFLINERDVRGVGVDALSSEGPTGSGGNEAGPLLKAGKWQLVNLTNLDRLPAKGAKLVIAPLRLEAGSAPARVIAILP